MAQALVAYGVAALLLAASAGPVLSGVRDASLSEFEGLGKPKPLDDFPFLKEVRPYLPPVVVEWLVVKKGAPQDLPPGGSWRIDGEGRVTIIWPSGCEESEKTFRKDSECDPTKVDCETEPDNKACPDTCEDPAADPDDGCAPPEIECPSGEAEDRTGAEPVCIPDPECERDGDDAARPDGCPPPPPPPKTCPEGYVMDYTEDCIALAPTRLFGPALEGTIGQEKTFARELTVPYENLTIHITWEGFPAPDWSVDLYDAAGNDICWVRTDDDSGTATCEIAQDSQPLSSGGSMIWADATDGNIPRGNYTLFISYTPQQFSSNPSVFVEVYGKPANVARSA